MLLKKRFLSSPYSFGRTLSAFVNSHGTPGASLSASLFDDADEVLRELVGREASAEEEGLRPHPEYRALQQRKETHPLSAPTAHELKPTTDWGLSLIHI